MRPLRLARIAAEAEGVRLRGMLTRIVKRIILGLIALIFILAAIVFAHIAAWIEIRAALTLTDLGTAGILGGSDLLLALILGLMANYSRPSKVEVEAYEVRRKAIEGIRSAMSMTQFLLPLLRILADFRRSRRR